MKENTAQYIMLYSCTTKNDKLWKFQNFRGCMLRSSLKLMYDKSNKNVFWNAEAYCKYSLNCLK